MDERLREKDSGTYLELADVKVVVLIKERVQVEKLAIALLVRELGHV